MNKHIFNFFNRRVATPFCFFAYQTSCQYSDVDPPGASNAGGQAKIAVTKLRPRLCSYFPQFSWQMQDNRNDIIPLIVPINPIWAHYNRRATNRCTAIRQLVHWPLMGGLLNLVQRGGARAGCGTAQSLLAVPNVTAHPSKARVPTSYCSMWHYNCLCALKGQCYYTCCTSGLSC